MKLTKTKSVGIVCLVVAGLSAIGFYFGLTHILTHMWLTILSFFGLIFGIAFFGIVLLLGEECIKCPKCTSFDIWIRNLPSTTTLVGVTPIVIHHHEYICNKCGEKFND